MKTNILFSIDGRKTLADKIVKACNGFNPPIGGVSFVNDVVLLGDVNKQKFSDGELCVDFADSVRGKRVYLLSSPDTSDEIFKLYFAIDAARRASASEIIPIIPYFPYARQDKKDQPRGSIGAKVIASQIENLGATSVITFDLHADQIQGFFDIPVTHIEGKMVFADHIANNITLNTILAGPDAGSGKRLKRMVKHLSKHYGINLSYVMMDKTREEANKVEKMYVIGDVTGKDVWLLDDMIDTAGTICTGADTLIEAGAKSVRSACSHPVLSGPAYDRLNASKLKELIVSDSLPLREVSGYGDMIALGQAMGGREKIKVISVAEQIGFAMAAINNDLSYEALKSKHDAKN